MLYPPTTNSSGKPAAEPPTRAASDAKGEPASVASAKRSTEKKRRRSAVAMTPAATVALKPATAMACCRVKTDSSAVLSTQLMPSMQSRLSAAEPKSTPSESPCSARFASTASGGSPPVHQMRFTAPPLAVAPL